MQEVMDTMDQIVAQDTEPDPAGGPGGRRLTQHVAPARRIAIEDKDMRHGRKSSAKTFNGFTEHLAMDLDSTHSIAFSGWGVQAHTDSLPM